MDEISKFAGSFCQAYYTALVGKDYEKVLDYYGECLISRGDMVNSYSVPSQDVASQLKSLHQKISSSSARINSVDAQSLQDGILITVSGTFETTEVKSSFLQTFVLKPIEEQGLIVHVIVNDILRILSKQSNYLSSPSESSNSSDLKESFITKVQDIKTPGVVSTHSSISVSSSIAPQEVAQEDQSIIIEEIDPSTSKMQDIALDSNNARSNLRRRNLRLPYKRIGSRPQHQQPEVQPYQVYRQRQNTTTRTQVPETDFNLSKNGAHDGLSSNRSKATTTSNFFQRQGQGPPVLSSSYVPKAARETPGSGQRKPNMTNQPRFERVVHSAINPLAPSTANTSQTSSKQPVPISHS